MSDSGSESHWDSDNEVFYQEEMEAANELELKLYALKELGLELDGTDADLSWIAWESFVTPPPEGWTEHVDGDGRVFFYNQITQESRWSHPGDVLFRELIQIIKALRAQRPLPSEKQRSRELHDHMLQTHRHAEVELGSWSGPYKAAEDGGEYYYNSTLQESAWESPNERWERELALRHAILHRCLLQDWPKELEPAPSQEETAADLRPSTLCLESLASSAPNQTSADDNDDCVSVCSARSFATVRSARTTHSMRSARSTRSARSPRFSGLPDKRTSSRRQTMPGLRPPVMPPASPSSDSQPAMVHAQSDQLPRFGASDADAMSLPTSPTSVESAPTSPPSLALPGMFSPQQEDAKAELSSPPLASPPLPSLSAESPPRIKSPPLCKVAALLAPVPKSPPCKVSAEEGASTDKARTSRSPSSHSADKAAARSPRSPRATSDTGPAEKDAIHWVPGRRPELPNASSPERAEKSNVISAEKVVDDVGAWLPDHAQRIIKRHLGSNSNSPGSPRRVLNGDNFVNVCDVNNDYHSDTGIVDSADIAGGAGISGAISAAENALDSKIKGSPADDAAAGDAAVMALVTGTRAPVGNNLPDKVGLSHIAGRTASRPESSPASSVGTAQFFNLYESDPENEEAEKVRQWLQQLGLGRYFEQLSSEGFDDMNILGHLEEVQVSELMEKIPMPMLHEQQLRRGLTHLRGDKAVSEVLQPVPVH